MTPLAPFSLRRLRPLCLAALAAAIMVAAPVTRAAAGPLKDASGAALLAALRAAPGGSVLTLPGGDYGALRIGADSAPGATAGQPITLRAADPADPPRVSELVLRGAAHLRLEGFAFRYRFAPGDAVSLNRFQIRDSTDIAIRRSSFTGDLARGMSAAADGYPSGHGIVVRGSRGIVLEGNEISLWKRGLIVDASDDVQVLGNDVHSIRSDGMDFAGVQGVLIEDNRIHDFRRALDTGDHADMIQFWTNGTRRPGTDIVIRNNELNVGSGLYTQSIFMRNEEVDRGRAGREMFYRNVRIEGNVILNAHLHGITLGEAETVTIRNNTLVQIAGAADGNPDKGLWIPRIRVSPKSENVSILANIASAIEGHEGQPGWRVADNLLIQSRNPAAPGYYDAVFLAARNGDPQQLRSFAYLPGGPADGTGIGSPLLALPDPATDPAAAPLLVIRAAADPKVPRRFSFEAGQSRGLSGSDPLRWDFGDGAGAEGTAVTHDFGAAGDFTVTLRHGTAEASTRVTISGPDLLDFESRTGVLSSWEAGVPQPLPEIRTLRLADGGHVLPLGGADKVRDLPPGAIAGFFGARDFDLRLRLRAASPGAAGEVLRIHESLILSIGAMGDVQVWLATAAMQDPLRLRSRPLGLNRGDWHEIALRYSAAAAQLRLEVDGKPVLNGRATGVMKAAGRSGLSFGNPFGKASFAGEISALDLRADVGSMATAGSE